VSDRSVAFNEDGQDARRQPARRLLRSATEPRNAAQWSTALAKCRDGSGEANARPHACRRTCSASAATQFSRAAWARCLGWPKCQFSVGLNAQALSCAGATGQA